MLFQMNFSIRARAEGLAIFAKSVTIYYLIYRGGFDLLAYAIAQVVYSAVLMLIYSLLLKSQETKYFSL
jgi:hypothetical protein